MALVVTNSDTLGLGSADTAALFHQIVFESKIYSALHGCIFASLNHAFRTWRWMGGGGGGRARRGSTWVRFLAGAYRNSNENRMG